MLNQVLDYINNYFVDTFEAVTVSIAADGISGSYSQTYLAGQYISIDGSKLNDGVYKIASIVGSKLLTVETLVPELAEVCLFGLAVPKAVLEIAESVKTYNTNAKDGIKSESQGSRSISYSGDSSWTNVYKSRLSKYKSVFNDKLTFTGAITRR